MEVKSSASDHRDGDRRGAVIGNDRRSALDGRKWTAGTGGRLHRGKATGHDVRVEALVADAQMLVGSC